MLVAAAWRCHKLERQHRGCFPRWRCLTLVLVEASSWHVDWDRVGIDLVAILPCCAVTVLGVSDRVQSYSTSRL